MIFQCKNRKCGYVAEQETLPLCCPECGGAVRELREDRMNGRQWTRLGIFFLEKSSGQAKRAWECFRRAALLGDAWGVSNLGWCMEAGVGVEASPEEAVWLYRQAVEMGFTPAL